MSEVVRLHVPETPETAGMIGATEIAAIEPGVCPINNSVLNRMLELGQPEYVRLA